jgi:uncharacterized protein YqcC (DUF446 family)
MNDAGQPPNEPGTMAPGPPGVESVAEALDAVETEMRANGLWDVAQPSPEEFAAAGAFGIPTITFTQWLRWVFVPAVRAAMAGERPLPAASRVAAQAVREWGWGPEPGPNDRLVELLTAFDRLFD